MRPRVYILSVAGRGRGSLSRPSTGASLHPSTAAANGGGNGIGGDTSADTSVVDGKPTKREAFASPCACPHDLHRAAPGSPQIPRPPRCSTVANEDCAWASVGCLEHPLSSLMPLPAFLSFSLPISFSSTELMLAIGRTGIVVGAVRAYFGRTSALMLQAACALARARRARLKDSGYKTSAPFWSSWGIWDVDRQLSSCMPIGRTSCRARARGACAKDSNVVWRDTRTRIARASRCRLSSVTPRVEHTSRSLPDVEHEQPVSALASPLHLTSFSALLHLSSPPSLRLFERAGPVVPDVAAGDSVKMREQC
ncbi:hypothetical protein K438DRAFT_1983334 [Mycena galopus ATCC 62051]|nr:hypothetical protein K438DRAFT_1983334 [Mycena galopus ATCC 62051]